MVDGAKVAPSWQCRNRGQPMDARLQENGSPPETELFDGIHTRAHPTSLRKTVHSGRPCRAVPLLTHTSMPPRLTHSLMQIPQTSSNAVAACKTTCRLLAPVLVLPDDALETSKFRAALVASQALASETSFAAYTRRWEAWGGTRRAGLIAPSGPCKTQPWHPHGTFCDSNLGRSCPPSRHHQHDERPQQSSRRHWGRHHKRACLRPVTG